MKARWRWTLTVAAIGLMACTQHVKHPGLPAVYGAANSVSPADLRAAIVTNQKRFRARHHMLLKWSEQGDPITFIRVVNGDTVELHFLPHDRGAEYYDRLDRRNGEWKYFQSFVTGNSDDPLLTGEGLDHSE